MPSLNPGTIYLVGGAVRDELMGIAISGDRDWLVVGSSTQAMLHAGFNQVGKDFPVFLHPQSKEEYALARKERKVALGYHGFETDSSATISLEDDLGRRDLTINAIAKDAKGRIYDPYNGIADIKAKQLRHITDAFTEDPVRILRIARFAARYADLGFEVAAETLVLMQSMVSASEVDALVGERVFAETQRALMEANPQQFLVVLRQCGALARVMPEVNALYEASPSGDDQRKLNAGEHLERSLKHAANAKLSLAIRFALLCHDLGKGLTAKPQASSPFDDKTAAITACKSLCERLRAPNKIRELALKVTQHHDLVPRAFALEPSAICDLFAALGLKRDIVEIEAFIRACQINACAWPGLEDSVFPQADFFRAAAQAYLDAPIKAAIAENKGNGEKIKTAIAQIRIDQIAKFKASYKQ